jgi:hypothetical protein
MICWFLLMMMPKPSNILLLSLTPTTIIDYYVYSSSDFNAS